MTAWPSGVSAAPPPFAPPVCADTTGSRKERLRLSTRSQARRYDIPISRPAAEIDPLAPINSSSLILPGPIARSPSKSMRKVSRVIAGALVDFYQLDIEHQRREGRNHPAGAARAVTQRGRDDQRALAAFLHAGDAFVPALDDLAAAEIELERLGTVERAVEFLALGAVLVQPAGVVDRDAMAGRRDLAGAD